MKTEPSWPSLPDRIASDRARYGKVQMQNSVVLLCLVSRRMKECSLYMFIPRFLETVWIWYDLIVWYRMWSVEWLLTKCAPWHEYNCVYVTSWSVEVLWPKNPTYPKCQKRRVRLSKAATPFNRDHLRCLHKGGQAVVGDVGNAVAAHLISPSHHRPTCACPSPNRWAPAIFLHCYLLCLLLIRN